MTTKLYRITNVYRITKLYRMPSLLALTTVAMLAACGDDSTDPTGPQIIEEVEFASSLGIDLSKMTRTSRGVFIQDLTDGEGEGVQDGTPIEISYVGWLTNASVFDAGQFPFTLGDSGFIAGWNEGIRGMKLGGTRRIVIPPDLAYGNRQNGSIPAGSILIFEINLLAIN